MPHETTAPARTPEDFSKANYYFFKQKHTHDLLNKKVIKTYREMQCALLTCIIKNFDSRGVILLSAIAKDDGQMFFFQKQKQFCMNLIKDPYLCTYFLSL